MRGKRQAAPHRHDQSNRDPIHRAMAPRSAEAELRTVQGYISLSAIFSARPDRETADAERMRIADTAAGSVITFDPNDRILVANGHHLTSGDFFFTQQGRT
jgi:hypothetical protein